MATSLPATEIVQATQHRYHFSLVGQVKEIVFQNKAIVHFNLNGKEEKGILLSKMFYVTGKPLEEVMSAKQTLADFIKMNELIQFDCHIYDKGGVGSGKDKCKFFIMKAVKYGDIWTSTNPNGATLITAMPTPASPSRSGTGWVSEISGLHGVLTYNYNGIDQRVSFHANRVFLFEKRLGLRHSLTFLLQLGEQLQFEAVPAEVGNHTNILDFCPMSATIVFKGKRPQIDPQYLDCPSTTGNMMCILRQSKFNPNRYIFVDPAVRKSIADALL